MKNQVNMKAGRKGDPCQHQEMVACIQVTQGFQSLALPGVNVTALLAHVEVGRVIKKGKKIARVGKRGERGEGRV